MTNERGGDHMKISKKILSFGVALIATACGVSVEQNEIHKIDSENSLSDSQQFGFGLAGPDFESMGDAATLTGSTNSLACAAGSTDGIRSLGTYNLHSNTEGMQFTIALGGSTGNQQKFNIIGSDTYEVFVYNEGGYKQMKVRLASQAPGVNIGHIDFPANNTMSIKIDYNVHPSVVRAWADRGNGWENFGNWNYGGATSYSNGVRLEYDCGGGTASTLSNVKAAGAQLDLSLDAGTPPPPPPPSGNVLEAENANTIVDAGPTSVHAGYTGTGFIDYYGSTGIVTWTGLSYPPGQYEVAIRYGNGSSRRVALQFNGADVTEYPLAVQGTVDDIKWTNWVTETQTVTASQTITSISIDARSGGPNLDHIEINPVGGGGSSDVPANFAFRLKADEEVTSAGGLVSSWGDVSTNNLNANQGNSGLQPSTGSSINGKPSLNFDGGDKLIIANNALLNVSGPYSQKTMSIAFRTSNDISSNQLLYEQGGGTRGLAIYISGGKVYFNIWNKANDGGTSASYFNPVYLSQDISPNTDYVVTGLYEFGGRKMEMRVNDSGLISNTQGDTRFGQLYNHGADVSIGGSASVVLHNNTYVSNGMYFTGTIAEIVYYNTALSAQDTSNLHTTLKDKYGASGSSGGGGPGSSDPMTFSSLPQDQRDYLKYIEDYIDKQTVMADNGRDHVVRTYNVGSGIWELVADTYDNSLAVQFFTAIGKPQKAARILDTWLRINEWNIANHSDTTTHGLFWPRVNMTDVSLSIGPDWPTTFLDVGNNSMMGMAFCKYYLQFYNDAPDSQQHKRYYDAAKSIMSTIHNNFQCNDSTSGYIGRRARVGDSAEGNQPWRSVEHNLDMYALGACVEAAASLAGDNTTTAVAVKERAGTFVDTMWDATNNRYRVGTGFCSAGPNAINNNYIAVDGITWRYLSKAALSDSSHSQKSQSSMATLVSDFIFEDTDWTTLLGGVVPYWGVPFSIVGPVPWTHPDTGEPGSEAYGAQQENVGAALLALNAFNNDFGANYGVKINEMRAGVKAMLDYHKGHGVPAHFEETINCVQSTRKNCNTGLDWSYARTPHTAATSYFGLALLYQFSDQGEINAGANPYSNYPSRIITQESVLPVNHNYPQAPKPDIINPYTGDQY